MKKYLYDDFKEQYYRELERKENYNNKVGIILSLYSLISIPLVYCIDNIKNIITQNYLSVIFYILFVIAVIAFAISIIFAIKSVWGYRYEYIPSPKDIDKLIKDTDLYYEEYRSYFSQNRIKKKNYIEKRKQEVMYEYYRDATTNNLLKNEEKIKNFNKWTYVMGIFVIFILSSCVLLQFLGISKEPTKVQIENTTMYIGEVKNNE